MVERFENQPKSEEPGKTSEVPLSELLEVIKPFPLLHSMLLLSITDEEWKDYADLLEAQMELELQGDIPPFSGESQA